MIHYTKALTSSERLTLAVYHILKLVEAVVYLGSFTLFSADELAAKWLFSRD
jgi:hypothetical protein